MFSAETIQQGLQHAVWEGTELNSPTMKTFKPDMGNRNHQS